MKSFLIAFIVLLIQTNSSLSQYGCQEIYSTPVYGITKFNSIRLNISNQKLVYIQHGRNGDTVVNESGTYYKLNKFNSSWFVPSNGFMSASWVSTPPTWICSPLTFFTVSPNDSNLIINYRYILGLCSGSGASITYNNGQTVTSLDGFSCGSEPLFPSGVDFKPSNDSVIYFGFPLIGTFPFKYSIFKSTNRGVSWNTLDTIESELRHVGRGYGKTGGFMKVNPFNENYIFTVGVDFMFMSTNSGADFFQTNIPFFKDLLFDYNNSLLYGYTNEKIYKSSDNGLHWDSIPEIIDFNTIELSPDNSNIFYGGANDGLYISSNAGVNWYLYNNSFTLSKKVIGLSKDPGTGDTIIAATDKAVYKVWASFVVGNGANNKNVVKEYKLEQNFPNPFNPVTKINYSITNEGFVKIKVYDVTGKNISTLVNDFKNPGSYSVLFDGSKHVSGVYFYRLEIYSNKIEEGLFTDVKRMLLIK